MLVNLIHLKSPFNRMRMRHELWKKKYPDLPERHGIPWTGNRKCDARDSSVGKSATGFGEPAFRSAGVHRASG